MAVTSGFFDSRNGDRKYNADQMSEYFRGIVSGGVFQHLDGGLQVTAGTGLAVNVAAGRAIVQHRWIQNSASLPLSISAASETYGRKDAVVLRLDSAARTVSIAVKTGTPAASPAAPEMTRSGGVYEMALAYVNVAAGATSVTVTDKRSDSTVCGWATVAQSTSGEVDQMLDDMKTGFDGVVYPSPAAMVQGCDNVLQGEIDVFNALNTPPSTVEVGTHPSTTINQWTDNSARLRVHEFYKIADIAQSVKVVSEIGTIRVYTLYYDANGIYKTNPNQTGTDFTITLDQSYVYCTFIISSSNYETFTPTEAAKVHFTITNTIKISEIGNLKDDIDDLQYDQTYLIGNLNFPINWIQGTVSSNGALTFADKRIRTPFMDITKVNKVILKSSNTFRCMLAYFNANKGWISNTPWMTQGATEFNIAAAGQSVENCRYVIMVVRIGGGTDPISPSNMDSDSYQILFPVASSDNLRLIESTEASLKQYINLPSEINGTINQIARIGWLPYTGNTPQQSIASYKQAYQNGCRIMLCDIRVTSDGYFVLWHDDDVSVYARTDAGEQIAETLISESTLAELKALDFGVYKSWEFSGTRILTLEELAKWCSLAGCCIMLETKVQLTTSQVAEIGQILKRLGLGYNTIVADDQDFLDTTIEAWLENMPNAMYCVRGGSRNAEHSYELAQTFVAAGKKTSISITSTSTIDLYGQTWLDNNIMLEYSEVQSESDLESMLTNGYIPMISYIASSYVQINNYIANKYGLI